MRRGRDTEQEVIIIEEGGSSGLKWLVIGAALGAGLALLLAPGSGEETRRRLSRQASRLRRAAEDTLDDVKARLDTLVGEGELEEADDEDGEEAEEDDEGDEVEGEHEVEPGASADGTPRRRGRGKGSLTEAREELERRLAAARARRGAAAPEEEEPVA